MIKNKIIPYYEGKVKFDPREFLRVSLENKKILKRCEHHNFSIPIRNKDFKRVMTNKYQCENCGGVVSLSEKYWYEKGLKDMERHLKKEK